MALRLTLALLALPFFLSAQADYKRYFDEDKLPEVRELFEVGRYDLVIQVCDYALRRGQPSSEWRTLRFLSLANVGRYDDALAEARATTELFRGELDALLEAHKLFVETGHEEDATRIFADINAAASAIPNRERTAMDLVLLGRAATILGADPSKVLEQYFDPAKTTDIEGKTVPPGVIAAHLASGDLALEKDDFARAAKEFEKALEYAPGNIRGLFGMAEAFLPNDRKKGMEYLTKVLEKTPFHIPSLLLHAEFMINFENYDEAGQFLDQVASINPKNPELFAYQAVLAEVERDDDELFQNYRDKALAVWRDNPKVDYLIGRVLSRKYRHQEGADAQLRALAFDPGFLPAKLQLALDYLRLGETDKAWPLAKEVGEADQYNTLAYNLEILEQEIASFASVKTDDFIIRMPPNEAEIYGDRVVEILTEAKEVLGEKYGIDIEQRTLIEFYPDQTDFAIRSFGALGGEGLLGVCFGSVVTMNSPGSITAGRNNWEATLWHEYCHVITLTATQNKMPRWLSEGISVYEEIQRNPIWGQEMTPDYRRRILEPTEDLKGLTPISEMSSAFFEAGSGADVIFAYYQSMLVVDFIVETFGLDALKNILTDLGDGVLINTAIAKHTLPMRDLEKAFTSATITLANRYGTGVDWFIPEPEQVNPNSTLVVASFLKKNPTNFWARQLRTATLIKNEQWDDAIESADALIDLLPSYTGEQNGYLFKAIALREKGDLTAESIVLEEIAARSAEALTTYQRLLELRFESQNWAQVLANADKTIAIDPFSDRLHYCRGCAFEAEQKPKEAITAFEKTLLLDPANPSEVQFRLARLLKDEDKTRAKRLVLDALADSPRYREAHALLLEIAR